MLYFNRFLLASILSINLLMSTTNAVLFTCCCFCVVIFSPSYVFLSLRKLSNQSAIKIETYCRNSYSDRKASAWRVVEFAFAPRKIENLFISKRFRGKKNRLYIAHAYALHTFLDSTNSPQFHFNFSNRIVFPIFAIPIGRKFILRPMPPSPPLPNEWFSHLTCLYAYTYVQIYYYSIECFDYFDIYFVRTR